MASLVQCSSQFTIATHSPIILGYPDSIIYSFSDRGITPIEYTETEHYRVTKSFLERREMMPDELMDDVI